MPILFFGRPAVRKSVPALGILFVLTCASGAWANKPTVAIVAPAVVEAGTEVTILLNVSHKGNSALHHTDRVVVWADGVEFARWEFKNGQRPESADFTRKAMIKVAKSVEISAQGHCNIHGSPDPTVFRIAVK
jgi:desulfoferrodoxin (superoxide reductase-like protein)